MNVWDFLKFVIIWGTIIAAAVTGYFQADWLYNIGLEVAKHIGDILHV